MHATRAQLAALLASAQQALLASSDRFTLWNHAVAPLRAQAGPDDREWIADRLSDLAADFGFPAERADMQRHLDSLGRNDAFDEDPRPGPHPMFRIFWVAAAAPGVDVSAALESFSPGGNRTSTWGALSSGHGVWIADVRPGATIDDAHDALAAVRYALATLDLKIVANPPRRPEIPRDESSDWKVVGVFRLDPPNDAPAE
jgi:hypothetical protein